MVFQNRAMSEIFMLRKDEIQIGNWLRYTLDGKYCTVRSIGEYIHMDGALSNFQCKIWELSPIKINNEMPTLFGFKPGSSGFSKSINQMKLSIRFDIDNNAELWSNDVYIQEVSFVHQLQNCYYDITSEFLEGNLYGSPV
jgi:hypothetical protein